MIKFFRKVSYFYFRKDIFACCKPEINISYLAGIPMEEFMSKSIKFLIIFYSVLIDESKIL